METEEALYAVVAEELSRGQVRQGLWTKALSEEGYDEQRAKALYIKLRVKALRRELDEAEYQERVRTQEEQNRAREEQKQNAEQAINSRLEHLEWRTSNLSQLQKTRSRIRAIGFWPPFLIASVAVFPFLKGVDKDAGVIADFVIAALIGVSVGLAGFLVAEMVRWSMPAQRQLSQMEAEIQSERENLEQAKMSSLRRGVTNFFEIAFGIAIFVYLVFVVFNYFTK